MSSHHIVREDQEPALLIDDIDSVATDQLNQLLEWSPIVITHDKNLDVVAKMGIKIDVLVTDLPRDLPQGYIRVLPFTGTFLDTALAYLKHSRCRAANVLSNSIVPDILLQYIDEISLILLGNGRRMFAVRSGFRKWKAQGELVYVTKQAAVSATMGLIQQSADRYLTEKDGFYSIRFTEPYGIIGELL